MAQKRMATFTLGGMVFEYDEEKNRKNVQKHGISFRNAARVFFDYDRIELNDEEHSDNEDRYDTMVTFRREIYHLVLTQLLEIYRSACRNG